MIPLPSQSRSEFVNLRGLRHHLRRWGDPAAPLLILLHGWLDVSASFEFLVAGLLPRWQVLAPDWRGFGLTEWPQDGYWFADYLADLDALLEHCSPGAPVQLIGHSMGGNAASYYAGLRPERVARLAVLDAMLSPDNAPQEIVARQRQWLRQVRSPVREPSYSSFEALAQRVGLRHKGLTPERALFVAHAWGEQRDDGRIWLRADPKHHRTFPVLYRAAESKAIWREVTAPTLFLEAGASRPGWAVSAAEMAERRACFRSHEYAVIENSGHMLHFEAPEATAGQLLRFFAGD